MYNNLRFSRNPAKGHCDGTSWSGGRNQPPTPNNNILLYHVGSILVSLASTLQILLKTNRYDSECSPAGSQCRLVSWQGRQALLNKPCTDEALDYNKAHCFAGGGGGFLPAHILNIFGYMTYLPCDLFS